MTSSCEGCIHYKEKYSGIQMWTFGSAGKGYCEITGRYILSVEDTSDCPDREILAS